MLGGWFHAFFLVFYLIKHDLTNSLFRRASPGLTLNLEGNRWLNSLQVCQRHQDVSSGPGVFFSFFFHCFNVQLGFNQPVQVGGFTTKTFLHGCDLSEGPTLKDLQNQSWIDLDVAAKPLMGLMDPHSILPEMPGWHAVCQLLL